MDVYDFLRQFVAYDPFSVAVVAALVGGAAFFIIQGIDAIAKNGGQSIPPNWKYWGAIALCFIIPFVSWVLVNSNDSTPLTFGGVLLAFGVSFIAATTGHWIFGGSENANIVHKAFANPGTPVKVDDTNAHITVTKP